MIKQREANSWKSVSYAKSITGAQTYTKFPIVLRTTDQPIPTWSMDGNTETSGTPSPSNPVMPNGVGERTENIYNKYNVIEVRNLGTRYGQYVPEGVYSIYNDTDNRVYWGVQDMQSRFIACEPHSTATVDMSVQHGSPNYGFIMPYNDASLGDVTIVQGSTAPDHYIPYGYKIPITNGGATTNIYLGSTQSTRQIKKLVLTGGAGETWNNAGDGTMYRSDISDYLKEAIVTSVCTHYPCNANVPSSTAAQYGVSFITSSSYNRLYIKDTLYSTATDFKNWLATEYANGTPVTVWYVLATATTATVNEPLMKIGTYADTLSNATPIPTTSGLNTIDINATVKPSEMSLTYDGYKLCKGQRYVGGVVNKFDESTFISDAERSGQTGEVIPNSSGYGTSELIPVESGKTLYFSQNGTASAPTYLYTYQSNGTFIQRLVGSNTYDVPNNCGYVAICIHRTKLSNYQIQYDEVTEYHSYYEWV